MTDSKVLLNKWVADFTDELYSWALYKVSDSELAQDLVQDTFLVAAEKIESFRGESSAKTWLFSILKNKIIDVYRKRTNKTVNVDDNEFSNFFDSNGGWKRDKAPSDWNETESHLLDNSDFQELLGKCLDALPEKWSTCIKLKYLSEKKGEEICQEVGIALTNYWQIVHRAKLKLRNCVEINWFER